ncbi:MAG: Crp/Fnr family transcriptional regulator [Anaerolineales bacterium]|nr:Crp/Fnr family transcriptional regulator [Anaerolineales bacterium]MCB8952768.1 Crp/Fnr family transcriptional regulator [Ardenticatenales bacterium]
MIDERELIVRRCGFLHGLQLDEVEAFLGYGRAHQAAAGIYLFHQDDPADLFYILRQGQIRLQQITAEGHQVIVHHVTPGEGFGIIAVLSGMSYPVSAETLDQCDLLCWDAATTKQFMLRYPQLALNGLEIIANHFLNISDRFRELATERVERRIARALLRLVRQLGRKTADGILIDLSLSRQALAEMTGTTLYTTSRTLSQWEKAGWITTGREQVVLVQPHEIVAVAEDLPNHLPRKHP